MKNVLGLAVLCLGISACTYSENGCLVGHYCLVPADGGSANAQDWTPTANATGPVDVVAAKCDMLAHGTVPPEGGAFAAGSAAFVSTVMASESLQQGMKEKGYVQNTIRDCMIINGFQRKH